MLKCISHEVQRLAFHVLVDEVVTCQMSIVKACLVTGNQQSLSFSGVLLVSQRPVRTQVLVGDRECTHI